MLITARNNPNDAQSKFFLITERIGTLPPRPATFDEADKAAAAGYFVSNTLLQMGDFKTVKTFQTKGADCIEVKMKDGLVWKPAQEAFIVSRLKADYFDAVKPQKMFIHPDAIEVPENFIDLVNAFMDISSAPVFATIRKDGGVRAVDYIQTPAIKLHFVMSGNCAVSCVRGDTNPTRSSVRNAIKSEFPYVADIDWSI